jgi:hypothetical protein
MLNYFVRVHFLKSGPKSRFWTQIQFLNPDKIIQLIYLLLYIYYIIIYILLYTYIYIYIYLYIYNIINIFICKIKN